MEVIPGLLHHGLRPLGKEASKVLGSCSKSLPESVSPGLALAVETGW